MIKEYTKKYIKKIPGTPLLSDMQKRILTNSNSRKSDMRMMMICI